jgi:hypothetical protein
MFLNISNHPSGKWSTEQLKAATHQFGSMIDMPFPNVPAIATTEEVTEMAKNLMAEILRQFPKDGIAPNTGTAMVQGEFSLCSELWRMLSAIGWDLVVATSERVTVDNGDGTKTTRFDFVQFRNIRPFV